jgi:excisionase family DNA binding protein
MRPSDEPTLLLRVEQAASLLGVSRSQLYMLINEGVIPVVKFGKSARISRVALEEWIADNSRPKRGA